MRGQRGDVVCGWRGHQVDGSRGQQGVGGKRLGQAHAQGFGPVVGKRQPVGQGLGRRALAGQDHLPDEDAHTAAVCSQRERIARPDVSAWRVHRCAIAGNSSGAIACRAHDGQGRRFAIRCTACGRLHHATQPARRTQAATRCFGYDAGSVGYTCDRTLPTPIQYGYTFVGQRNLAWIKRNSTILRRTELTIDTLARGV